MKKNRFGVTTTFDVTVLVAASNFRNPFSRTYSRVIRSASERCSRDSLNEIVAASRE